MKYYKFFEFIVEEKKNYCNSCHSGYDVENDCNYIPFDRMLSMDSTEFGEQRSVFSSFK